MGKIVTSTLLLIFFSSTSNNIYSQSLTVDHISIEVSSLEQSAQFYKDVFRFETIEKPNGDDKVIWLKLSSGVNLQLVEGKPPGQQISKGIHFAFSTNEFEKLLEYLLKNDFEFESYDGENNKVSVKPNGFKQLYLKDPDGYWIEVNSN